MEVVTGVLTGLVLKLGKLLVGEYNLQKGVKGEIMFLQPELQSMQGALQETSKSPPDQLDQQDKIWASEVRELSYDIEDSIDTFMVRCEGGGQLVAPDGMRGFIDRSLDLLTRFRVRRQVAMDIRDIKRRVIEVRERREVYKVDGAGARRPDAVDPRLLAHYAKATDLVGIDEARDELIKMLLEGDEAHGRVVSVVGCGGLGKTTLANVVYHKIRTRFDCWAFVSVSQTPDMRKLFKAILSALGKGVSEETLDVKHFIDAIREFLQKKRYCVVVDDIWDIKVWKMIRCALPDNNMGGHVIITTTRNFKVAEEIGGAHNMKPLCHESSKRLFYRRIFGNGEKYKCPDDSEHLAEVSDRILKKCAGVPLAIITIASLLANRARDKMEWLEVCNSIGTGLEDSTDVENMRKILAYSYYGLKHHLRICLLYLSMFPEDYAITKNHLIWMWIAEGFVQCEQQGKSLFELGECYFNELMNSSMIQPGYDTHEATIDHCRVHDMVLEVIRSLSSEENFVTILNSEHHSSTSPSRMFRRLSLQNSAAHLASPFPSTSMRQVRSVIAFSSYLDLMPAIASFRVLRVLNLKGSYLPQGCDLKHLGNLLHLRYLGLGRAYTNELPDEIGNLRHLQTLDVVGSDIGSLPSTVVQLRHLMCLCVDQNTRVPNGIGSLTTLEELSTLYVCDESTDISEELRHLTELRELELFFWNNALERSLVACLRRLRKIQSLVIWGSGGEYDFDSWVAPRQVRRLQLQSCWFSRLPDWMTPSLMCLSLLWINVRELHQEDLEALGRLPALRHLYLKLDHEKLRIPRIFVVGACLFPCLVECRLLGFMGAVFFHQGAMTRLKSLAFTLYARDVREITSSSDGGCLDLGLGNLVSLQHVMVYFRSGGAGEMEVEEAKAALTHVLQIHPNHLEYDIWG